MTLDPKIKGTGKALPGLQFKMKGDTALTKTSQAGFHQHWGGPAYIAKVASPALTEVQQANKRKGKKCLILIGWKGLVLIGQCWQAIQAAHWQFLDPGSSVLGHILDLLCKRRGLKITANRKCPRYIMFFTWCSFPWSLSHTGNTEFQQGHGIMGTFIHCWWECKMVQ